METTNEELRASSEEMQSVNEEVQSSNEELETSKEELQSVNEELSTVNAELQTKVVDLTQANNDMSNLLAGTGIATVFLDHSLRILRFTPSATKIINLIPSDMGRPVGHIVSNLRGYADLMGDIQAVLDSLIPKQMDVQSLAGAWYMMRILPYRTLENVIEGVVLTFVDITSARESQAAARRSEALLWATQRLVRVGGWEWDVAGQSMFWTKELYRLHDLEPDELQPGTPEHVARSLECFRPEDHPVIQAAFQKCLESGHPYDLELAFTTAKGRPRRIRTMAEPVLEKGKVVRVVGAVMDVTERSDDKSSVCPFPRAADDERQDVADEER